MATKILGIDIGSVKICAAMVEVLDGKTRVIAIDNYESKGLKKGSITNIELATNSIKTAVDEIVKKAGVRYDKVIVSISGKDIQESNCSYSLNIHEGEVTIKQIETAVHSAEWKAKTPQDYEIIHTLPYSFKIDGQQDNIEDPLGMNGSRLEVDAYNIAVSKSALMNLRKALEKAGITPDNIVLSGYASAIATLNDDEKALGAVLIDLGGDTCNMVIHAGNSIRHSDFLAVGSSNITNDLSVVLKTSLSEAEEIKRNFESLIAQDSGFIQLTDLGDEHSTHEVDIDFIKNVVFSRMDETLMILAQFLEKSGYSQQELGAGVVLTGGMTRLGSIRKLASDVFGISTRIAKPKKIDGLAESDRIPANSCALGLCLYGAGHFTPYEIDSERKLRYKGETVKVDKSFMAIKDLGIDNNVTQNIDTDLKIDNSGYSHEMDNKIKISNPFMKLINWVKEMF